MRKKCQCGVGIYRSEGYFEDVIGRVKGDLFCFGFCDVTAEQSLNVADAIIDVVRTTLSEHLNGAVHQIAYVAG